MSKQNICRIGQNSNLKPLVFLFCFCFFESFSVFLPTPMINHESITSNMALRNLISIVLGLNLILLLAKSHIIILELSMHISHDYTTLACLTQLYAFLLV
ncbi:hypothetical protein ACE6H2_006697 [Prunus campanulata]